MVDEKTTIRKLLPLLIWHSRGLVILDEFACLINYKTLGEQGILDVLDGRSKNMYVDVTVRDVSERLIAVSDLVTEMQSIRYA